MKWEIEGLLETELVGGVERSQMRVVFSVTCEDRKHRSIDCVVEREVWNGWSQERRREYVLAVFRSALANLVIGEVPDDLG